MIRNFRHKTPLEIRFVDIDAFGHVNNANYLSYIEQARIRYFNEVVKTPVEWEKQGIILARAEVDYLFPLTLRDTIEIYTRCSRIGNKSFDLEYLIVRAKDGSIASKLRTVLVAYDYENQRSMLLPSSWSDLMRTYDSL
jgi:acyl-CoA thioester hydrolase